MASENPGSSTEGIHGLYDTGAFGLQKTIRASENSCFKCPRNMFASLVNTYILICFDKHCTRLSSWDFLD